MYAAWGVDFLKYDLCSFHDNMMKAKADHPDDPNAARDLMIAAYKKMGDALRATGRPIVYSLCQYGVDQPWKWGPGVGAQMWRTTDDIDDSYGRMIAIGFSQAGLSKYAGPGHWNDPDMLEVGNGKMTEDEYKTHMSLWVLLAAPLLAGNDLSKMTDADKSILMNREAIAIDQDPLGKQGDRLYQSGDFDVDQTAQRWPRRGRTLQSQLGQPGCPLSTSPRSASRTERSCATSGSSRTSGPTKASSETPSPNTESRCLS